MGRRAAWLAAFIAASACNGAQAPRPTPPPSSPVPAVAPIDLGSQHSIGPGSIAAAARTTCVVRGGRVFCFGDPVGSGDYGHDPDATATPRMIPGLADVAEIALGRDHACVRRRSGTVACWGTLDDGTLGEPNIKGGYRPRVVAAPTEIANLRASAIAVGDGFSCAIVDGSPAVACWGMNDSQSLGRSGPGSLRPLPVDGIDDAVEIRARGARACVRRSSGDVWCWGDANGSQSGALAAPRVVEALHGAVKLAMTEQGPCVLRAGAKLVCERNPAFEDTLATDAIEVAYTGNTRCALRASGEVACDDGDSSRAIAVAGVHDAVAVVLGSGHGCALERAGAILCWGQNDAGQTANPFRVIVAEPSPVAGVHDAVRVAVSGPTACAIDRSGGAWCWGDAVGGALGISSKTSEAYRSTATRVAGVGDAIEIVGGNSHFCALTRRGTVTCWGQTVGLACVGPHPGDDDDCPTPVEVPGLHDAIDISTSREGNCAVRKTGTVICWGRPYALAFDGRDLCPASSTAGGRCGVIDGLPDWKGEPRVKAGVTDAVRVFNGYRRLCVVRRDGTAACWGDDVAFEASAVRHSSDRLAVISGLHDVVEIGLGQPDHVLSRTAEVRAFDWGNSFVPGGTKLTIAPPLPKVIVADVVRMAQGFYETCVVRRSGEVACWSIPETPVAVGIDDAIDIAIAESGTRCVARRTGEVACWGENASGQCGIDPGARIATPRQVQGLPPP